MKKETERLKTLISMELGEIPILDSKYTGIDKNTYIFYVLYHDEIEDEYVITKCFVYHDLSCHIDIYPIEIIANKKLAYYRFNNL